MPWFQPVETQLIRYFGLRVPNQLGANSQSWFKPKSQEWLLLNRKSLEVSKNSLAIKIKRNLNNYTMKRRKKFKIYNLRNILNQIPPFQISTQNKIVQWTGIILNGPANVEPSRLAAKYDQSFWVHKCRTGPGSWTTASCFADEKLDGSWRKREFLPGGKPNRNPCCREHTCRSDRRRILPDGAHGQSRGFWICGYLQPLSSLWHAEWVWKIRFLMEYWENRVQDTGTNNSPQIFRAICTVRLVDHHLSHQPAPALYKTILGESLCHEIDWLLDRIQIDFLMVVVDIERVRWLVAWVAWGSALLGERIIIMFWWERECDGFWKAIKSWITLISKLTVCRLRVEAAD